MERAKQESLTAVEIFELVRDKLAVKRGILVPEGNVDGITKKLLEAILGAFDDLGISIGLKAGTRLLDLPRFDTNVELTRENIESGLTICIDALDPHLDTYPDVACPMRGKDLYEAFITLLTL